MGTPVQSLPGSLPLQSEEKKFKKRQGEKKVDSPQLHPTLLTTPLHLSNLVVLASRLSYPATLTPVSLGILLSPLPVLLLVPVLSRLSCTVLYSTVHVHTFILATYLLSHIPQLYY